MKYCFKCKQVKSLDSYYMDRSRHDGKQPVCKDCHKKTPYDPEKRKIVKDRYRINNPNKCKEHARNSRKKHPETHKKWVEQNKEKVKAYKASNRAKRKGAQGKFTGEQIDKLYVLQKGKCACCKIDLSKKFHRDHIYPLSLGGSNNIDNIQLLCSGCNLQKGNKEPITYMQTLGFLL